MGRSTFKKHDLRDCRESLPSAARQAWAPSGQAAQEEPAVGDPYEAFRDPWIALIVELAAAVAHQQLGLLDHPPVRQDVEADRADFVGHLHGDVALAAVTDEGDALARPGRRQPPGYGTYAALDDAPGPRAFPDGQLRRNSA